MSAPTQRTALAGDDDRTGRVAAAADRLLARMTPGLGPDDEPDAESVATFLRDLAADDEYVDPATAAGLDALGLAAVATIEALVRAGFEVTADPDALHDSYIRMGQVLDQLRVANDPTVEVCAGPWLRCVRAAAVLRRDGR